MKNHETQPNNIPWEAELYKTGSTMPPKEQGGFVAVLLMLVIVLGSVCSMLGLMNLRLLQQLTQQQEEPGTLNVFESAPEETRLTPIGENADSIPFPRMGLEGQTVTDFDRRFYELPQGVLVTFVTEDSFAHRAGLHEGDVITSLNGHPITSQQGLEEALAQCPGGKALALDFFRHQTRKNLKTEITLPEE